MLLMLTHNQKGTETIQQIAPVNPLGKDFTSVWAVTALALFWASRGTLCYDLTQCVLSKWGLTWNLSLRCYSFIVTNAKRRWKPPCMLASSGISLLLRDFF